MRAEDGLASAVDRGSRERGDKYFEQGRVLRIVRDGDALRATVRGSQIYAVTFVFDEDDLVSTCACPFFSENREPCKHIWASIRAASAQNLLPDRELFLAVDAEDDDDVLLEGDQDPWEWHIPPSARELLARHGYLRRAEPPKRPAWQRFLESLGPSHPGRRATTSVPEEIAYVIWGYPRVSGLTLEILGRARKKNGEPGRWKGFALDATQLNLLPPFDRENLALLQHRSYSGQVEKIVGIAPAAAAWWIERLARAERLFVRTGDATDLTPITWDDGAPWTLEVRIENDAAESRYQITARVVRGDASLPFEDMESVIDGIIFIDHRACRFDDRGQTSWLQALRTSGPVEIPYSDTDAFRDALLRAPVPNITLPPELGWTLADVTPQPILALVHDGWSSELHGELLFQYGEWRVSILSREAQKTFDSRLIRRDTAREDAFRARLTAAGAIAVWDGFRVRQPQLEQLVRTLSADGWSIEIDRAPVQLIEGLELEISSGIDWFDLDVSASFGDRGSLALPQLLAASEAKKSLVRLADGSYGILPTGWDDTLAPLVDLGKQDGDVLRFRPSQSLLVDALLGAKAKTDPPFRKLRERITSAAPAPRQEPATLRTTLRPYQRAGLGWLHFLRESGLGGCLADDMGLGKTVQTLAILEELRAGGNTRPSLVVAPRSLLFNWATEAKKFAPALRVVEHHGASRANNTLTDCDIVLTTYATMRLDVAQLSSIEFEYVILDEAQAIKNASSQVAKATRLLRSQHRLALSGTPIENHLGELWSLFEFLNPGLLGSARAFSRTFTAKNVPPERREALARALRPLILRRTKDQVAPELPERIEQTLYCELEGLQKAEYEALRDHYREALLGRVQNGGIEKARMQILEALLRLRQAACAPALIEPSTNAGSAKLELLMNELRDVVEAGHRALVFSQFTGFLALLRRELDDAKLEYLYLDGKTRDRQSLVEHFQSGDGPPLFLISLKAGGLGLNLTNADYIFLLDPWWNPAVEAQAIDRAHRIGRQKPVVAYRLIARDTVEEKILELQARKRELADSIISQDNSVLRKLEVEDLELLLG